MSKRLPALVLLLGLVLAFADSRRIADRNERLVAEKFEALAQHDAEMLSQRLELYQYGLRGLRGMITAIGTERFTRGQMLRYFAARDMSQKFPGARGLGYIRRVARDRETDFVRSTRLDGQPRFAIHELAPHPLGERFVIQHVEPLRNKQAAVGFDIASEPMHLEAARNAVRNDTAALTQPIALQQFDERAPSGFLLLLPVYRDGMPLATPGQRWAATAGWVYAPLLIDEILNSAGLRHEDYRLQLSQRLADGSLRSFYRSGPATTLPGARLSLPLQSFDQPWQADFEPTQEFVDRLHLESPLQRFAVVGAASLLLASLLQLLMLQLARRREAGLQSRRITAIVDSASDAIVSLDADGRISSWNPAAERIFGYPAADILGLKADGLLLGNAAGPGRLASLSQGLAHEMPARRKDGKPVEVSITAAPICDSAGAGTVLAIRDVTERKLSDARFELAVEAAPNPMLMLDAKQRIVLLNHRVETLFGWSRDELVGKPFEVLVAWGAAAGEPYASAYHRNGRAFPVQIEKNPIELAQGWFMLVSLVDMSERRRFETRLEHLVQRMQLAMTLADVGVWTWEVGSGEMDWDARTRQFHGLDGQPGKVPLERCFAAVHPEDRDAFERQLRELMYEESGFAFEFRGLPGPGLQRFFQASGLVERDETGRALRVNGITREVTVERQAAQDLQTLNELLERQVRERTHELERAVAEAQRANAAKSAFLTSMSHELRTPMNAILGFAQLIALDRRLDERVQGNVQEILRAGRHLLSLINEVLDLSRIDSGKFTLAIEPVALEAVATGCCQLIQSLAQQRGISVSVEVEPGLQVLADRTRLNQVLLNLMSNAVKYNRDGGSVWLRATASGDGRVRIAVRDDGVGIAPEEQARVFEPFHRSDATACGIEGTGIGLTLTRHLVIQMRGEIGFESQPGVGSEFWVVLPTPSTPG